MIRTRPATKEYRENWGKVFARIDPAMIEFVRDFVRDVTKDVSEKMADRALGKKP